MYRETTIASTATAPGEGGIGIVRISGKDALSVGNHIFRMKNGKQFGEVPPFSMHYGHVADGDTLIDEGLGVFMKGPHSYTGEDVVEIQIHGSMAALRRTLRLAWHFGAVPAQRGEFTERAFLNGRLDLAQAEAVMGYYPRPGRCGSGAGGNTSVGGAVFFCPWSQGQAEGFNYPSGGND